MSSKLRLPSVGLLVALVPAAVAIACAEKPSTQTGDPDRNAYAEATKPGGSGVIDPGSAPPDCKADDGVEQAVVVDFQGGAPAWFIFDDGTAPQVTYPDPLENITPAAGATWGMRSTPLSETPLVSDRCGSTEVLHVQGGPFTTWGGGLGGLSFRLSGALAAKNGVPDNTYVLTTTDWANVRLGIDASEFTGISFWARRGPNSQPSMRVGVTDQYTNEIAARLKFNHEVDPAGYPEPFAGERACRVARYCGCSNGRSCNPFDGTPDVADDEPWYFCWDPATDPAPNTPLAEPNPSLCPADKQCSLDPSKSALAYACWNPDVDPAPTADGTVSYEPCTTTRADYPACGSTRCFSDESKYFKSAKQAPAVADLYIDKSACTEFTLSDGNTDMFCYDPGVDPEPPALTERCGDAFGHYVTLSEDWEFYTIPFSELAQLNYSFQAPRLATESIWSLSLGFAHGPVDFYIDDIAFYR